MAKVTFNAETTPIRGRVGDWIYRELSGQTIVSHYVPSRKAPTRAEMRSLFKQAAAYAKSVTGSVVWHEVYAPHSRQTGRTVFSAAVTDYLKPPEATAIDLREYHGRIGDRIVVAAGDEFGVVAVEVAIRAEDNKIARRRCGCARRRPMGISRNDNPDARPADDHGDCLRSTRTNRKQGGDLQLIQR